MPTPSNTTDPATWAALLLQSRPAPKEADPRALAAALAPGLPADLLEAALAWLSARPELAAAFGRPTFAWGEQAPRREPLPYAVLADMPELPEYSSADDDGNIPVNDRLQIQVAIYAANKDLARALARPVEAAFADAPLRFAAGELLQIRRTSRHTAKDPGRGPGGVDVWQRVLIFECDVARTE